MTRSSKYPGIQSYTTPTKGRLWECRYDEPSMDGLRSQRRKRGFKTQAAAIEYQRARQSVSGKFTHQVSISAIRLDDYLEQWLNRQFDLAPSTRRNYRNRLKPIAELIGNITINRLRSADIEEAFTTLRRNGHSVSAVRYGHRILKQSLKRAVELDAMQSNPCDRVTPPKGSTVVPDTWTRAEMQAFLISNQEDPVWGDFWVTLCETWLRVGELTDLRWSDIDVREGAIKITHAVRRGEDLQSESTTLKTAKSRRTIPVSQSLIDRLVDRKERMGNPTSTSLVFPSQRTESWIEPHVARKALAAACDRAGVPSIGLHGIRHSGGSIAYKAGIDIKTISERLGHSDTAFTVRVYVHLNDEHHRTAAQEIWRLIAPTTQT